MFLFNINLLLTDISQTYLISGFSEVLFSVFPKHIRSKKKNPTTKQQKKPKKQNMFNDAECIIVLINFSHVWFFTIHITFMIIN